MVTRAVLTYSFVVCAALATDSSSPGVVYHSTAVKWATAAESCRNQSSHLTEFRNAQAGDIYGLQISVNMQPGRDVWTGDCKTFEVINQTTISEVNELSGRLCVSATLTSLRVLRDSMKYGFNYTLRDCLEINKYICKCTVAKNVSYLYVDKTVNGTWQTAFASCRARNSRCSLWLPEISIYKTEVDGNIANGTIELDGYNKELLFRERYWTRIRIKEITGLVSGNTLTCGYIAYKETRIMYGSCDQRKGFVCENRLNKKSTVKTIYTVATLESVPSSVLYIVICVLLGIIVTMVVVAVVVLKKRNKRGSTYIKIDKQNRIDSVSDSDILSEGRPRNGIEESEGGRAGTGDVDVIQGGSGLTHMCGRRIPQIAGYSYATVHMGYSIDEDIDI